MQFQTEVLEQYSTSQNQAKRTMRRCEHNAADHHLQELDNILEESMIAGKVELGVMEIPVNQIVGIASDSEKDLYTSDFMPLPSIKSEFADKWCRLYIEYLSDRVAAYPISCYEYLGQFYVLDGKKRVSVAKSHGALTIAASVIRLLPVKTEDEEITRYYEFLESFELTGLYQVTFTQSGSFEKLQAALGHEVDHVWTESDRFDFMFHWYPFERALQIAYGGHLNITTADAVLTLLEDYSYAELKQMPIWTLAELMQNAWQKLYKISNPEFTIAFDLAARKVS